MTEVELHASATGANEKRIIRFVGKTTISFHVGNGYSEQHYLECNHEHVDYDAAKLCGARLAKRAIKNPAKFGIDVSRYVPWPANGYRIEHVCARCGELVRLVNRDPDEWSHAEYADHEPEPQERTVEA